MNGDREEQPGRSERFGWGEGDIVILKDDAGAKTKLATIARVLACEKKDELDRHKAEHDQIERPDFLWHYLLQSFATMGRAAGWHDLIGNKDNYEKVRYDVLTNLLPEARARQVVQVCRAAKKVRWPETKTRYILGCFEYVHELGGPEAAKDELLSRPGRVAKIKFLRTFPGIGPKYARNIMMDVYHEDFRDSIAIDSRIQSVSEAWGLSFSSFDKHEEFYLSVARDAGLNGWELDRLMFNFKSHFLPSRETQEDRL